MTSRKASSKALRHRYLDSATKWLYNESKGTKVFAIYGIGDGTEPNVLYAVGGKKDITEFENLNNYLEEYNEKNNGNRTSFNRVLKNIQDKQRTGSNRFLDDGNGRANAGDVQFPIEKRGSDTGRNNVGSTEDSESGINFSERDPDALTNRQILAEALETATRNGFEKELSFAKGKRDTEKLSRDALKRISAAYAKALKVSAGEYQNVELKKTETKAEKTPPIAV